MDNRNFLWIFNNIDKYSFSQDSAKIKESISRLLITEDSLNSPEIVQTFKIYYDQLVSNFYNNIIGYQNGLSDKKITSNDMDCYFISTAEGLVPIGYYRLVRPAETASLVQRYLEQCRNDVNNEKNNRVADWQKKVDAISEKYDKIKDSKNPSIAKGVVSVCVSAILFMLIISVGVILSLAGKFSNINGLPFIYNATLFIPTLNGGNITAIIIFFIFLLTALFLAVLTLILSIKEFKLVGIKKKTEDVLRNSLSNVTSLEAGISQGMNACTELVFNAARQGQSVQIIPNNNKKIVDDVNSKINIALNYVSKNENERKGIPTALMVWTIIITVLFPLTYTRVIPASVSGIMSLFNGSGSGSHVTFYDGSGSSGGSSSSNSSRPEPDFSSSSDYIYPSNTEYLTRYQLENMTRSEIALVRNEIYARHGYIFNTEEYRNYFSNKSWYTPNSNFNESMFNSIEKANKDLIVNYEIEMGWR